MNNFIQTSIIRATTALGIGIIALIAVYSPPYILSTLFGLICVVILLFEWPILCKNPYVWLITPFYLLMPFIFLIHLNHMQHGRLLLTLLFLVIWSFDTGSYFAGSWWGKTLIRSSVSKGKTWEGALGGLFIACIAYLFFCYQTRTLWRGLTTLYIPLVLSICGLLGDLFESYLKRKAQIKDSGNILPGHGGLLDRFDSILCAVILVYIMYSPLITTLFLPH